MNLNTAMFTILLTLGIQEKVENTYSIMVSKFKITSIRKHTVNTEVDSALGLYRLSR
jgi:hypothetical protein